MVVLQLKVPHSIYPFNDDDDDSHFLFTDIVKERHSFESYTLEAQMCEWKHEQPSSFWQGAADEEEYEGIDMDSIDYERFLADAEYLTAENVCPKEVYYHHKMGAHVFLLVCKEVF